MGIILPHGHPPPATLYIYIRHVIQSKTFSMAFAAQFGLPIAIGLAATAASYPLTRKWDMYVDRKRKSIDEGVDLSFDNKRRRLIKPIKMAFRGRRRRTFRRRGRRRVFKKRRFARRRFQRRVRSVILRTLEPRKIDAPFNANIVFREGDGVTRTTYLRNVWAPIAQDTTESGFSGNKFYAKGFTIRGQLALADESDTHTAWIRFSLVHLRHTLVSGVGTLGPGFLELNSGTTAALTNTAGTVIVSLETVPALFESTGAVSFVGNGYVIPFDKTNCTVIKSYTLQANPSAVIESATTLTPATPFNLYFSMPRRYRMHQIVDPTEGALTGVQRFKHGAYYLIIQTLRTVNSVAAQDSVSMDYRMSMYWRDV